MLNRKGLMDEKEAVKDAEHQRKSVAQELPNMRKEQEWRIKQETGNPNWLLILSLASLKRQAAWQKTKFLL